MKSTTIELALDGVFVIDGDRPTVVHLFRIDHDKVYIRVVHEKGKEVTKADMQRGPWSKVPKMGSEVIQYVH